MDESREKSVAVVAGSETPCNGDDIIVEVFGSSVYVGGVCTSGGGDEVGRNELGEVEMGFERNVRSVSGDGGEASEVGAGEVGVSGGEAELVEERRQSVAVEEVREDNLKGAAASGDGGFGGGETQVVDAENGQAVARDTVSEKQIGGLVEAAEQGKKLVEDGVDLKVQKVSIADDEVWNPGIDDVAASSLERAELLNGNSQVSATVGDVSGNGKGDIAASKVATVGVEEQCVKIEPPGQKNHNHINVPGRVIAARDGENHLESKDQLRLEESVENMYHDIAQVGSTTLSLPAQLIPGGVNAVTSQEGLLNFENHQHLKPEEIVDKNTVDEIAKVGLKGGQEMEVDGQGELGLENGQNSNSQKSMNLESEVRVYDRRDIASMDTDFRVSDVELVGLYGGNEGMEVDSDAIDGEQPKVSEEIIQEAVQPESSQIAPQPSYELPHKYEGVFSVSDLVWGKVKSHPWWPGQIFDFMAASEKAMKHHKKDCFLVAYFGDRTFAWNEVSSLKPFRSFFSQAQKQCSSETFQRAVSCVLEEVSRRVELGLSCSCIPKDVYEKIKFQTVENAGICHESSRVEAVDESASASSFESENLLKYVKALALFPSAGTDQLELAVAKAHLLAYFRLKGYCGLPEFFCGDLLESKTDHSLSSDKTYPDENIKHANDIGKNARKTFTGPEVEELKSSSSHKRKHNLREGLYAKMKERSLSELMGGEAGFVDGDDDWFDEKASPSSGKRQKGAEYQAADVATQDGRKAASHSTVSNSTSLPKQSFKIGACIQRAASQLSGSTIVKLNTDRPAVHGFDPSHKSDDTTGGVNDSTKYLSLDELLSQLQLAAQEPLKEYDSLSTLVNFFSDFRNSLVAQKSGLVLSPMDNVGGRKRKSSKSGLPETFEFDDMNDTYWTDMVVQNGAEEQPQQKRKAKYQPVVLGQPENPPKVGRRPYTRRRYSEGTQALPPEKPVGYVDENAPAELVMNFSEVNSIPSETNLNKMFKRFGPLKEYETEVDRESSRARVVFKKCSDAEVACNSAGKFNIFGQITVSYQLNYTPSQLNYTPSITFSASTSAAVQDQESQLVFPSHDHEMHLDLSTHDQMQLDLSTHDRMQLDLSAHDHMQLDLSTHDEMQLDLSTFEVNLV